MFREFPSSRSSLTSGTNIREGNVQWMYISDMFIGHFPSSSYSPHICGIVVIKGRFGFWYFRFHVLGYFRNSKDNSSWWINSVVPLEMFILDIACNSFNVNSIFSNSAWNYIYYQCNELLSTLTLISLSDMLSWSRPETLLLFEACWSPPLPLPPNLPTCKGSHWLGFLGLFMRF